MINTVKLDNIFFLKKILFGRNGTTRTELECSIQNWDGIYGRNQDS